ncbi:hypothetical protein G5B47_19860 [Paenibacillus sp. 7124]|uniref:TATA-box binding n=1 Tax=Paenibacillus apii TaxID=1850370 RepID=A0A6M1PN26_9BACL|nr:YwmB family TATA-box binding protein [Paenibacillus apii]NGM84660.1 hypothetical protein [Paenibacillus apii]NJJ41277.1 hypothetical protein [Paenibacillus apii]
MGNRGRVGNKGILLMFVLCFAALMLAEFRSGAEASPAESGGVKAVRPGGAVVQGSAGPEEPSDSVALLTELGRSVTEPGSPLRLVFKWQGSYTGEAGFLPESANSLAKSLGLPDAVQSSEEGHAAYRSSAKTGGMKTSLFWSEMGEGASYVIVTLETNDLSRTEGMAEAADEAGSILASAGIAADWNVSLQGMSREHGEASRALKLTERTLEGKLPGMSAAETYTDAATASTSYTVPSLAHTAQSGKHHLALQAAVHQDDVLGGNRVTLGLPLITIEY